MATDTHDLQIEVATLKLIVAGLVDELVSGEGRSASESEVAMKALRASCLKHLASANFDVQSASATTTSFERELQSRINGFFDSFKAED